MKRIIAVMLMMPLLAIFANVVGMAGGLLIAVVTLDITPIAYYHQLSGALGLTDWAIGLTKAAIFGVIVAIVGCWRGMRSTNADPAPGVLETVMSWKDTDGWPSWAFSNHDAPRVVSRWGSADRQDDWAKLLLALLMGLRGNVFLYQGEELGLSQAQVPFERLRDPEAIANWPSSLGRDGARTPMPWSADGRFAGFSKVEPWLPMPEEHKRRAVAVQDKDPNSVLECTRQLVALRKTHPALRLGKFVSLKLPSPLLGFERVETGEQIRCLFNLGDKAVRCPMIKEGQPLFVSGRIDQAKGMIGGLTACWLRL